MEPKTYEQGLEMMHDIIEKVLKRRGYLKTPREDLRQDAAVLLWQKWDLVFASPSPKGFFYKTLDYYCLALYEKEHYQGLWSQVPLQDWTQEADGKWGDPYLEKRRAKCRERYRRIKADPEIYAVYRAKRNAYGKAYYERLKADPEKHEAYKAACRERSRAYYQAKKENNGRGVKV